MPERTIFITGSSTGLGRATALIFASRGWKVIATMRAPEKEVELASTPGVTVLPLDVTDRAQIAAAAQKAIALGGVDVLFNNAGYGLAGPLEGISDDQLTREIGISTDFAGRSLVLAAHPAYDTLVQKVYVIFRNPERRAQHSTAAQIAEIVYEAATDGKDQVRYVAGEDAKAMFAQRLSVGFEAFRQGIRTMFFG